MGSYHRLSRGHGDGIMNQIRRDDRRLQGKSKRTGVFMKKKNLVRDVLKELHAKTLPLKDIEGEDTYFELRKKDIDQAEAQLKKIFLEWVGERRPTILNPVDNDNKDFGDGYMTGYNQAKQEIRTKINASEEEMG